LLDVAAGLEPFSVWVKYVESAANRQEKLDPLLRVLYGLLEDLLVLERRGHDIRNVDVRPQLDALAARITFAWIRQAVAKVDELAEMVRRNIQKNIALDALIAGLRPSA
jgi:DNA polymerase-3 subunit delta'